MLAMRVRGEGTVGGSRLTILLGVPVVLTRKVEVDVLASGHHIDTPSFVVRKLSHLSPIQVHLLHAPAGPVPCVARKLAFLYLFFNVDIGKAPIAA